jgi:DNA-binding transcriptional MerR regulator
MNISEASKWSGISRDMIRFYEKKGLLHPCRQSCNQYRDYSLEDVQRLVLIRQYNAMGISLDKVRDLLASSSLEESRTALADTINSEEERLLWARAQIDNLKDMQRLLDDLAEAEPYEAGQRGRLWYYPSNQNPDCQQDLYRYGNAARAIFLIEEKYFDQKNYPDRRGYLFFRKPPVKEPPEVFKPHGFVRTIEYVPRNTFISTAQLRNVRQRLAREGFATADCMIYQLIAPLREGSDTIPVCLEFWVDPLI